jgi:hypothetical protein
MSAVAEKVDLHVLAPAARERLTELPARRPSSVYNQRALHFAALAGLPETPAWC